MKIFYLIIQIFIRPEEVLWNVKSFKETKSVRCNVCKIYYVI